MRTLVVLFFLLVAATNAKVFERCEWARTLRNAGMDGYRGVSLAEWLCLTDHESSYSTHVTTRFTGGSTDYGIFQINNRWWCNDGSDTYNGCNIQCSELMSDDPAVAINCAKRVVRDPQGVQAWGSWTKHCRGRDLSSYIAGCGV